MLTLRRECETTGFGDVEEMAVKFGKWWQRSVISFGLRDVGVETLIGCGIEGVITAAANGAFDELGVNVGYSSMIAVAH